MPRKDQNIEIELADLKGQVKDVFVTCYRADNKNGRISLGIKEITLYNPCYKYSFFESGNKKSFFDYDSDGSSANHIYDENGMLINLYHYKIDESLDWTATYIYNDQGNETEHFMIFADGKLGFKQITLYNSDGNRMEFNQYGGDGILSTKYFYKYDENGFCIEHRNENAEGKLQYYVVCENNHKGHCMKHIWYDEDGKLDRIDDNSKYINEDGKMIPSTMIVNRKSLESRTYEFENDYHDNWIKKTVYYKKVATHIYLREINYYGEESNKINNMNTENKNISPVKEEDVKSDIIPAKELRTGLNKEDARWLADGTPTSDNFNYMRYYFIKNNEMPSQLTDNSQEIEIIALKKFLIENLGAEVLHTFYSKRKNIEKQLTRFTLGFPNGSYILHASQINGHDSDEYDIPYFIRDDQEMDRHNVWTSQMILLHPSESSDKRDEKFEQELERYMNMCYLDKMPDKPEIYMVQVANGNYTLKSHAVHDDFEIKDLDLNYGNGFIGFHNELMMRFQSETKGLVLFHGEPGTGKTYYIRHLLKCMANKNKIVIYMPPNMVDHLVEPTFMTFISQQVEHYSQQELFCVLLIEDAEPLLAARQSETRIQGVTNLLNMTDGLLNDMLNLQIICTFNVKVAKLDKALLRPGRLIARKEFKALPEQIGRASCRERV